ncbi:MAG: tetratricopeptide repeat protein [Blastocatellia bacterium]|nr:tetratricopeptide repeat protein [Blastocatellia bacterium]
MLAFLQQDRAVELFERAQDLHERGEYERAVVLYREVIAILPDAVEPKYQCAAALLATDKAAAAQEASMLLEQVIGLNPQMLRAYELLAEAKLRCGDTLAAERLLTELLKLDPKNQAVRVRLAELALRSNNSTKAVELLEQTDLDKQGLELLAVALEGRGDARAALSVYDRLIALSPEVEYFKRRGVLRLQLGEYALAVEDLSKAPSTDADAALMLAEGLIKIGRKDEALSVAEGIRPADALMRARLAEVFVAAGKIAVGINYLEQAVTETKQSDLEMMARLAELLIQTDAGRAIEYWQQVLAHERRADYITGYASALLKSGKFAEAAAEYRQALKLQPSYEAKAGLALALFKLEAFAEAAQQFLALIEQRPTVAINYYFLAICFDKLGDLLRAERAYLRFKELAGSEYQLEVDKVNLRLPILRRQIEKKGK